MFSLTTRDIKMGQFLAGKQAVISALADWLEQDGNVEAGYGAGMLDREAQAATYLGQGIAIPHGTQECRHLVKKTGIKALHLPEGVDWGQGEKAYLVLGIAAGADEHRELLRRLARALSRDDLAERVRQARNSDDILQLLQALQRGSGAGGGSSLADNQRRVTVRNHQGLHARPGAILVQIARQFDADIRVRNLDGDGHDVNAKSLMKLIGLGVRPGHQLLFTASGPDARDALNRLEAAVNDGLGEEIPSLAAAARRPHAVAALAPNTEVRGVAASPGIAIGEVYVEAPVRFDYADSAGDVGAEHIRLERALKQADRELAGLAGATTEPQARDILTMHRQLLSDPALLEGVQQRLQRGASAAAAWWTEIDSAATRQAASPNDMLAERAADLRDIGRRVMAILCDTPLPATPDTPYIRVAEDMGPSDVVNMKASQILGLVTAGGGSSSHSAILARSLGIPAVVAMGGAVMSLKSGTPVILNGDAGTLHVAPDSAVLNQAIARQQRERSRAEQAWLQRHEPAMTTDGHRLEVGANLEDTTKTADAVAAGAEGIGLLRTELLFMGRTQVPNMAQQVAEYRQALTALDGRPLVARTLDMGGDKPLPWWPLPREANPFLGMRGIRLCMQRPELLETQLRALLVAAGDRPLRIMFPMVADWSEWRFAKSMFDRIQAEVQAADVQLGMMVEVPSAALSAHLFAEEADFFSIGTNDLTQYTLAADRSNGELATLSDGLHPAVLRLVAMTVAAAHAQGKWVGVCGELGSDPQALPILLGLGVDEVSVSPQRVPLVKARVRECSRAECAGLAERALQARDARAVRALTGEML